MRRRRRRVRRGETWGTEGGEAGHSEATPGGALEFKNKKINKKRSAVICAAKHAAQQPCFLLGVSQQLQLGTVDNTFGFMLAVGHPAVSDLPQFRQ